MKVIKHIFLFLAVLIAVPSLAQNFPPKANPPRLVNDFLHILSADQEQALEQKLVDFDKRTSTQITIVTTDDIAGMDAGDYAVELGNKWGVGGTKEFNNGVVFLIYRSKDQLKKKVFIATGKGLEGVLPDYTCSEIIDNEVRPYLKAKDFYRALDNGTTAIIKATEGKYTAPAGYGKKGKGGSLFKTLLIIFLIIIFLSVISKGGGGGSYMSRRGYTGFGGPTIWWGGGGSSGWGGGSSSGGGGFGGFGGGSFGGGGAGGDW